MVDFLVVILINYYWIGMTMNMVLSMALPSKLPMIEHMKLKFIVTFLYAFIWPIIIREYWKIRFGKV